MATSQLATVLSFTRRHSPNDLDLSLNQTGHHSTQNGHEYRQSWASIVAGCCLFRVWLHLFVRDRRRHGIRDRQRIQVYTRLMIDYRHVFRILLSIAIELRYLELVGSDK